MPFAIPDSEFDVTVALAREILREQHPDLAGLPIAPFGSGWDNHLFRLGDALILRFPRRRAAEEPLLREQQFLPRLAPRLPLPVPTPVRIGVPSALFPWSFSVVPWLAGEPVGEAGLPRAEAPRFAAFLRTLHQQAPEDAPYNRFRGVPLQERAEAIEARLDSLRTDTPYITARIEAIWRQALQTELTGERCWLHGDLYPLNILWDAGQVSAVIDWGDLAAGDVASDLACTWTLFSTAAGRHLLLDEYQADPALRARAMGWAVGFGALLLAAGLTSSPTLAELGKLTLQRLDEDTALR